MKIGICEICKKEKKVCRRRNTGSTTCHRCYLDFIAPKSLCECGRFEPAAKIVNGKPYCKKCFYNKLTLVSECYICHEEKEVRKQKKTNILVCEKCHKDNFALKRICACGKKTISAKVVDGEGFCDTCYRKKFLSEECDGCHEIKVINCRSGGNFCSKCWFNNIKEKKECHDCGEIRRICRVTNNGPVCERCSRKYLEKRKCTECPRVRLIQKVLGDKEYCSVCYKKYRLQNDESFRVKENLRDRLASAFRRLSKGGKKANAKEYGIDYQAIFEYIGECPGDRKDYHIDHIKPLCLFDFDDPEQVRDAFRPENHQWLTKEENMKKGSKYNS
jgi:hypothetical protein